MKRVIAFLLLAVPALAQTPPGGYGPGGASGGGTTPNSANQAIPGPPVFNVRNYGATGNSSASDNCSISGLTNLSCTDAAFTAANVGQRVSCALNFSAALNVTTFSAFVDATNMTLASSAGSISGVTCVWGTPDDAGVSAALTAAIAQMQGKTNSGNPKPMTATPTLYFPGCCYNLFNTSIAVNPATPQSGFKIQGDGFDVTRIYWNTGTTNAFGAVMTATGNVAQLDIRDLTLDGARGADTLSNAALYMGGANSANLTNVKVQRFGSNGIEIVGSTNGFNVSSTANQSDGIRCQGCNGEFRNWITSNNSGHGWNIAGVTGESGGPGLRIWGGLGDENGLADSVTITNSSDVWIIGASIFSGSGSKPADSCLHVDGFSFVHWSGGICGVFGTDTNESAGVVDAGGVLQTSDVRFVATGTGKCMTNNGSWNDNGGNSCETMFQIVSGTSTATAAVLTVTPATSNVNTLCTVGDSLLVQGAGISGYNGYYALGITAVGTNTISYTTAGSNLGALGAGGVAFCRNLQTFTGNLPKALLNNPVPNTCFYTITPIANATSEVLCNFVTQSATNITRITASSHVSTTCATAPIVTISNGTVSETLTLTSGKSAWDSAVDTSTGVGTTIFKPNTTITVTYDAGALSSCVTPPTNLSVSYNIAPILSN